MKKKPSLFCHTLYQYLAFETDFSFINLKARSYLVLSTILLMGSCFSYDESQISLQQDLPQSFANPYVNQVHEITTKDEFNRLTTSSETQHMLILCDFYAIWCRPCSQCAPTIHKWALNEYKTNVIFMKVDVDRNNDLANEFSISILPTFVLFKQGKEVFRLSGTNLDKLKKEMDRLRN